MNSLSQVVTYFTYALEYLGLYEPNIDIHRARIRLDEEKKIWKQYIKDRDILWNTFQGNNEINRKLATG